MKIRTGKKVDPVEVFEYKKHTIMGFSALEEESWVPDIARKMVLSHHERMNGSGFPMRQKIIGSWNAKLSRHVMLLIVIYREWNVKQQSR